MRFDLINDAWYCYSDDDIHEEALKGAIQKGEDDFWWFYGSSLTVLTCRDCRKLAEKLSEMNIGEGDVCDQ